MTALISYAQNFEDVMLWRALGSIKNGFYVDIGAQSPDVDSVSKMFHEHGWRGIHIDAMASYVEELRRARPGDVVIHAAVLERAGTASFFQLPNTGLSTTLPDIAEGHRKAGYEVAETRVPAITLDDVFEGVGDQSIHWMKIDVEGGEKAVLDGWSKSSVRPWIVVVESTLPMTQIQTYESWEPLILDKGYRFAYFDGLNRFYVADGHDDLFPAFATGPNVFDGFELSGTSTATFGAQMNAQLLAIRAELEREKDERAQERLEWEERYVSSHTALRVSFDEEMRSLAEERAKLVDQVSSLVESSNKERRAYESERVQLTTLVESLTAKFEGERRAHERERGQSAALVQSLTVKFEEERRAHRIERGELAVQLHKSLLHGEWLHGEWNLAKIRLDERIESEHRWQASAQVLERTLEQLYASTSWRITAPLRATKILARMVLGLPGRIGRSLVFRSKSAAKRIMLGAMRYSLGNPRLRMACLAILNRHAGMTARLRKIALQAGLVNEPPVILQRTPGKAEIGPVFQTFGSLSRRGNEVLAELHAGFSEKV